MELHPLLIYETVNATCLILSSVKSALALVLGTLAVDL